MADITYERLLSLVSTAGDLLGSPRLDDVLPGILRFAREFVAADGYAVWRFDVARERWYMASHAGVSDAFAAAIISSSGGQPVAKLDGLDPIAAEDVHAMPMLENRREAYRAEGIRSALVIPIPVGGLPLATLVFYYHAPTRVVRDQLQIARVLGSLAGAALRTADLHAEQLRREQQALFLARAAAALASSLDYEQTLKTLAQLAVPHIADWCAVDMVGQQGAIERLAVAHVDPEMVSLAEAFNRKYPPDPSAPTGLAAVLRTGRADRLEQLTAEMIDAAPISEEHRADIRALNIQSYMIVPLRTRQGNVGAITFVSAESGRRFTDADLRFAETVADRAAVAIENAWAYGEARLASQSKDEFLATLSHELRTPLNAIRGYARMLRSGAVPSDRREHAIEVIERNAASLGQIVEEILDVSRIISGKLKLHLQPVDPAALVEDAIATVAPAAEGRGIAIRAEIDHTARAISADPDRLQQVCWNLLTNALKFTPAGGSIDVGIRAAGDVVEMSVRDTGRGIAPTVLPYVFDRFRQGDSHNVREHGGLGLGLSIARSIVELHGGTITAESPGENLGATFTVRLPNRPAS